MCCWNLLFHWRLLDLLIICRILMALTFKKNLVHFVWYLSLSLEIMFGTRCNYPISDLSGWIKPLSSKPEYFITKFNVRKRNWKVLAFCNIYSLNKTWQKKRKARTISFFGGRHTYRYTSSVKCFYCYFISPWTFYSTNGNMFVFLTDGNA